MILPSSRKAEAADRDRLSQLADHIAKQAVSLWSRYLFDGWDGVVDHIRRALPALVMFDARVDGMPVRQVLLELLTQAEGPKHISIRAGIFETLGETCLGWPPAVHAMALELDQQDRKNIDRVFNAIGRAATPSREVLCALVARLPDQFTRKAAAVALTQVDPTHSIVLHFFLDRLRRGEEEACVELEAFLDHSGITIQHSNLLSVLRTYLDHSSFRVRASAAGAMKHLQGKDQEVLKPLLALLSDQHPTVRGAAAQGLARVGHLSPTVRETLVEALSKEDDEWSQFYIAESLLPLLPHHAEMFDLLIAWTAGHRLGGRLDQVWAELLQKCPDIRRALLSRFEDEDVRVRITIIRVLAEIPSFDAAVVEALSTRLSDANGWVRLWAASTLLRFGETHECVGAVETIVGLFDHPDPHVRLEAVGCWGMLRKVRHPTRLRIAHDFPELLDRLISRLTGEVTDEGIAQMMAYDGADRMTAAMGLHGLSVEYLPLIDALLVRLTEEPNERVRRYVAKILGRIGCARRDVIEALTAAITSDLDGWVRASAAQSLGRISAHEPVVLDALVAGLADGSGWVRRYSTEALEQIGSAHSDAEDWLSSRVDEVIAALAASDEPQRKAGLERIFHNLEWVIGTIAASGTPASRSRRTWHLVRWFDYTRHYPTQTHLYYAKLRVHLGEGVAGLIHGEASVRLMEDERGIVAFAASALADVSSP